MWEVDFTGWVRTEEELKKIKKDWKYRLYLNFQRFRKSIKYRKGDYLYYLFCLIFNKNNF